MGDLGDRVHAAERAERIRTTPDVPNVVRTPHGPGWALVGDAGLVMDPITGQGIGHAFGDAELVTDAIAAGLGGSAAGRSAGRLPTTRDGERMPMYLTTPSSLAFSRSPEERAILFDALAGNQADTDRFFGVITGAVSPDEYFSPRNLMRVVGLRGMARMARLRMRASRGRERRAEPIPA